MNPKTLTGRFWHDLWLAFFILIVAAGIMTGQGLIIAFGGMGLAAGAVSWVWNRVSLDEVSYERQVPTRRVFAGEELPLTVALTNKKPVPLAWIHVEDEVPDALEVVEGTNAFNVRPNVQSLRHSTSMAWYERVRWQYRLRCNQRGLHRIGPAQIESGDPFGFLRSRKGEPQRHSVMVYPRIVPLEQLGIPASRPLGEMRGGLRIFPDATRPAGLREYERGDALNTVDWKATAKKQSLHVRTFDPSSAYIVVLVVAVDTATPHWRAYVPKDLERVITAAASVARYAVEKEYALGLFSNDLPVPANRPMTVQPSRDREQISVILSALATIRPFALAPMANLLSDHARRFPVGATLVVSTAHITGDFVATLGDLKRRGYKIVVLYVGKEPCPGLAQGIIVHQLREYIEAEEANDPIAG